MSFHACKQNVPQLAIYVPKDAASVFAVDTKAITDKINSSGITMDSLVNMFNKDDSYLHWSDIENSGIDLSQSIFVFSNQSSSIQSGSMKKSGVIASIKDKDKLVAFLKKQKPDGNILKGDKYEYLALGDNYVAGWSNKVFIISQLTGGNSSPGNYNTGEGTLSQQQLTMLFSQSESNSVASIDEFNNMMKKPGDIHFWSNASGSLNALPMLGMTKIGDLFQDTYTDGTIDFENGKIIASAETHFNKTLSDILEKYPSREIDKSMISRYPQTINGFGIVAFNPKVIIDILHYLGYDMMADNYISQMGFTMNDVVNAFSGDVAIMFSDFKMEDRTAPQMPGMPAKKPGGEFLLNLGIGDKTAFDKVMNGLVGKNILSKNGDEYEFGFFGKHNFVIEATDENLFIASDDALVKAYEAGNNKSALTSDVENGIKNKSMAIYVDVASMLHKSNTPDTSGLKTMQAAQATFKNFIASTDKSNGKSTTGNFELNMMNTNENSLASLVKFIAVAHENKKNGWTDYPPLSHSNDSLLEDNNAPEKDSQ